MTRLTFKYSIIKTSILPSIDNTKNDLSSVLKTFNSMYIPSSFRYNLSLNETRKEIANLIDQLDDMTERLVLRNQEFTQVVDDMNLLLKGQPIPVLPIRDSAINE